MIAHFGDDLADTILKETYKEYEALIPKMPYVGGENNIWTSNLIQCTWSLALYRALKIHGKTAEEAGQISYEMVYAHLFSSPEQSRNLIGKRMFSKNGLQKMRKAAADSQKWRYPEDWVSASSKATAWNLISAWTSQSARYASSSTRKVLMN
jgi:hypothetical protein